MIKYSKSTFLIILWGLIILLLLSTLFFGIIWIERLQLDYNSEGRFLNENIDIVYDNDGKLAYGLISIVSLILLIINSVLLFLFYRKMRNALFKILFISLIFFICFIGYRQFYSSNNQNTKAENSIGLEQAKKIQNGDIIFQTSMSN